MLIPCLTVFTYAYSNDSTPLYWTDERGYYCDSYASDVWENYIDVDKYRENAGKPGYDELRLVGISVPVIDYSTDDSDPNHKSYYASFSCFFYNPQYLSCSFFSDYGYGSIGSAEYVFCVIVIR